MKKGDIVECTIESIAFGGAGVAKVKEPAHDGTPEREFVVFVQRTAPGDVVKAQVFKKKKNYAEARLIEVVKESGQRVEARCEYFGKCGGCKMQFLAYDDQLKIKQQQVQDALQRIGGFKDFEVETIIPCEDPWFYRNKMEFSFAWEEKPEEGEADPVISLGLHPPHKRFEVLDLETCYLQSKFSAFIVNEVRAFARERKWVPYSFKNGDGFARSLFIREGKYTGEVTVNLVTNKGEYDDEITLFLNFLQELSEKWEGEESITSAFWTQVSVAKGRRTTQEEQLLFGKETLRDELRLKSGEALQFDILPQAFFQPNTRQAGILYSQIFKYTSISEDSTVFDLFCGTGTIGLFCAQKAGQVYGIELNESAVVSARSNAKLNGLKNVEFYVGDVGKMVDELDIKPDVIVVDPPRCGVGEKALEKLVKFNAQELVYVSCNPTTLARDLQYLRTQGYELEAVQPVDMFPHTAHIESVAKLSRVAEV